VFVGRSQSPTGPFLDRSGIDLNDEEPDVDPNDPTDARIGGSPVIVGSGGWVGTGHNTVFQDASGQWWTIYHAIDVTEPYFEGGVDIFDGNCAAEGQPDQPCGDLNKRPPLLDALTWIDGWPVVNGGAGISTTPQPAPAAQEGDRTAPRPVIGRPDRPSVLAFEDAFDGPALDPAWTWLREPAPDAYTVEGGVLRMAIQAADLFVDSDNAPVLLRDLPNGNWVVETQVRTTVPPEGCCFNYAQAGLVVYADDDNYLKLTIASIWNTRQTEWAKETASVRDGYPRYGNSVVGPPGEWTTLRIVKRIGGGTERYTAYTRCGAPGCVWEEGMTWTHELGQDVAIGLVAMGGGGPYEAEFEFVRVSRLAR